MAGAFGKVAALILGAGLIASSAVGASAGAGAVLACVLLLMYTNRLDARDKRDAAKADRKPRLPRKNRR